MTVRSISLAWMSMLVAAGFVAAAAPQGDSAAVTHVGSGPRPLSVVRLDVRSALRAEALARRRSRNASEVLRLVDLYRELAAHPKRDESGLARELGLNLRSRLVEVSRHIERRSNRRQPAANQNEALPAVVRPKTEVLAQQVAVPVGAAIGQGGAGALPAAAQPVDYGPQLVEIIQATISPATWDINGGNGSVVYFAPSRALVVRARETVHRQVGDLLWQLRAVP